MTLLSLFLKLIIHHYSASAYEEFVTSSLFTFVRDVSNILAMIIVYYNKITSTHHNIAHFIYMYVM